jgi:tetratricopeptide (TPR) repeat protein
VARRSLFVRGARQAALAGCLLGLAAIAGACASHPPAALHDRLVRGNAGGTRPIPKHSADLPTAETVSPALAEALAALSKGETPDRLRDVALEYQRLRVFDQAEEFVSKAIALAPKDAGLYDLRARIWRDSGLPDAALGDAYRAAYMAPSSAAMMNTLGTVHFALGQQAEAVAAFKKALALEPGASFASTNLCYVALLNGDEAEALARCGEALAANPSQPAARNNLALIHAAAGRLDDARREFMTAGPVAGHYNMGIVFLARREYSLALGAFEAALRVEPRFDPAFVRAQEARALVSQMAARGK